MDRDHQDVPAQAGSTRRAVLRGAALAAGAAALGTAPVVSVLGLSPLSAAQASGHVPPPPGRPPVFTTGTWEPFSWEAPGQLLPIPAFLAPAGGAQVLLVDVFLKGDRFQLLERGRLLGETSAVVPDASGSTSDPDAAWADPSYSRGTFSLRPGRHELAIRVSHSPHPPPGGAYYRIDLAA